MNLEEMIEQHHRLREAVYHVGHAHLGEHEWLRTAYGNASEDGIQAIYAKKDGTVQVLVQVWTNQTGGSNEWIDLTLPREEVEEMLQKLTPA